MYWGGCSYLYILKVSGFSYLAKCSLGNGKILSLKKNPHKKKPHKNIKTVLIPAYILVFVILKLYTFRINLGFQALRSLSRIGNV